MEKTVCFHRSSHALIEEEIPRLNLKARTLGLVLFLSSFFIAHNAFAGIPEIYFPPDLELACQSDTSVMATGMPRCTMHCDCPFDITYLDEIERTGCAFEFIIYRRWIVEDTCGFFEAHTQEIRLQCLENLGITKEVVNIDPGSSGVRGNFNATFEITFENTGNAKLTDLFLQDPIAPGYGSAFLGIVPGGEPKVVSTTAMVTPTLNIGFDGVGDVDIFTSDSSCLKAGERVKIQYTIEVAPNAPGRPDTASNQAYGGGTDPCMIMITDLSDTGDDPYGVNPGELGNMGTANDPTLLPLVCIGTGAKAMACNKHTNISLDDECSLDIPASTIIEGDDWGCDVFYEVMITDHHGHPIPRPIPGHFKGETLHVKVIDAVFGNSCWGTVLIEDKFAPTVICENDTIYCNALDSLPEPIYFDNCDPNPTLHMLKMDAEVLTCDSFYTKRIVRRWQAEDEYGNRSKVCEQVIMLRRIPIDSIDFPQDFTIENKWALKCDGVYPLDTAGHPSPEYTGAPSINGIPIYPYYQYCNISADYSDRIIQHGPCIKKIMRLWRVVEWICGRAEIREVPQVIHIVDDEAPMITCPTVDYVTTNGGYVCEATVDLPPAHVIENCSGYTVDIHYPGGILKNQNGGRINLPFGVHDVIYVARDSCYNESRCTLTVEVQDHTPPVTVCDGFTTVGLNEYGEAHLYAMTLDDGTYDDCYLDSFAVRRMDLGANCNYPDSTFRPFVRFCCDDVDTQNVMVVFRAWDKAGNYNDCMVEVEVQDKVPPSVYCPPNITVSCEYHFDMDSLDKYFGTIVQDYHDRQPIVLDDPYAQADGPLYDGHVLENCEVSIDEFKVDSLNQCRTGFILRGFTITDRHGLQTQCYQRITIQDYHPFDSTDIIWPLHYETSTCGTNIHPDSLPTIYGRPQINDDKCSLVGMEWEDHIFSFVQDSLVCFKVLRKWKIIDWCNFRMVNNNYVYESWHYEQIIKVNNTVDPVLAGDCEDISVCTYDPDCEDGRVVLTMSATDDCTPTADLKWEYKIDAYQDGIIDTVVYGSGGFADATNDYPIGDHYIIWAFEDQCGNKGVCRQSFSVVNCKKPTAYCKNGIIVDLMPIDTNNDGTIDLGEVEVWASDLDDGSHHSCGNPVTISFSADTTDIFRTYNCDSLGMRMVQVYVTDRITGEQDFCITFVEIQDNNNACPMTSGVISGILMTESHEPIHDVSVEVTGQMNMNGMFNGAYNFAHVPFNGNYVVKPTKNDDHLNGISTRDIVLLQRHLLGIDTLDSPLKIIAADANGDNYVSVGDMVEIRRLLLGYFAEFPSMTSWRFVDGNHVFTDPTDPFIDTFDEKYVIDNMQGNMFSLDFDGVKVGDLDQSANPDQLKKNVIRSAELKTWKAEYLGNRVLFIAENDMLVSGAQFTLNFDPREAQLTEVSGESLGLDDRHIGVQDVTEGIIRVAYDSDSPQEVKAGEVLLTLSFDATVKEGHLKMVNYPLASEIYDDQLNIFDLQIKDAQSNFAVLQNEPNPFAQTTTVSVEVAYPMTVQFRVYDMNGRTYIDESLELATGLNMIDIDRAHLGQSGVYYYQVGGEAGFVSKKMILMD